MKTRREHRCSCRLLLSTAAILFVSPLSAAEVHKWVDENGVTHYSSRKPDHVEAEKLSLPPQTPKAAQGAAVGQLEAGTKALGERREVRSGKDRDEREAAEDQELRMENCRRARDNLSALESSARRLVKTGDGEIVRLTEEERQNRMDESRAAIAEHCGS